MKIFFPIKEPQKVLTALQSQLEGRKLGDLVKLAMNGKNLVVTFSKLGTSTLNFTGKDKEAGTEYELTSEKIALAHRAFKDEVKEKLLQLVEKAGGTVKS